MDLILAKNPAAVTVHAISIRDVLRMEVATAITLIPDNLTAFLDRVVGSSALGVTLLLAGVGVPVVRRVELDHSRVLVFAVAGDAIPLLDELLVGPFVKCTRPFVHKALVVGRENGSVRTSHRRGDLFHLLTQSAMTNSHTLEAARTGADELGGLYVSTLAELQLKSMRARLDDGHLNRLEAFARLQRESMAARENWRHFSDFAKMQLSTTLPVLQRKSLGARDRWVLNLPV